MKFGLDGFTAVTFMLDIIQGLSSGFAVVMGIWGTAKGLFS